MPGSEAGSLFAGQLRGTVTRILFENRDSGWCVVRLEPDEGSPVTVVGLLGQVTPGENLEVTGRWEDDTRFGTQFRAVTAAPVEPDSEAGTLRYLASGVIPGIGPELARRLVDRFRGETLRVLDEEPERLLVVRGIGPKRLEEIRKAWVEKSTERRARIFLQGHGLGPALAERVLRAWGVDALARVKREPYELVREVRGIGFRTADVLALKMGLATDSPERVAAGLRQVLRDAADHGDCFVPAPRLLRRAARLLELSDAAALSTGVARLIAEREVVRETATAAGEADRVYLTWLHGAEHRVARRLALLASSDDGGTGDPEAVRNTIRQAESELGLELGELQLEAVARSLEHRLLVVTGGPGTGKTTLVHVVVRAAEMLGRDVVLAAPTGRAAKRLEQATGRPGRTLHRLLEYRFDVGFTRGPDNPLDLDVLVVDEVSMVDLPLMEALLAALPPHASLLLVGDADQLPPVGPGAVLRDLIDSDVVPKVRLTEIYRQASRSLIVRNAHRVNAGLLPVAQPEEPEGTPYLSTGEGAPDFYLVEEDDADRARDIVIRLVTRRIPSRFGLDPMREVQVLAPMHRGRCGVARLNAAMQDALNPGAEPARPEAPVLRIGDRVMQLRNDYDRDVFNGDVGHVVAADPEEGLTVQFDSRLVGYDRGASGDLALAYATTVHKSQGSEYPAVVMVLLPEHRIMLQRNLLYTALTRGRHLVVVVSTSEALRRAVGNASPGERFTTLAERIRLADASAHGRSGP